MTTTEAGVWFEWNTARTKSGDIAVNSLIVEESNKPIHKEIYSLRPREKVLFSVFSINDGGEGKRVSQKQMQINVNFNKLRERALKIAEKIEDGPKLAEAISIVEELQGCRTDVRVVVARDSQGHKVKGFTLIGKR